MAKVCSKCNKTVYPLEELKCLEKIWHKSCFKCWDCGMTLNMKTYKGFDKKPYCSAHYPHLTATMVSDTPEMQRLAQNTKLQSQVKYHEDFEKNIKGSKIEVTDDPETLRVTQVSRLVSQLDYKDKDKAARDVDKRRQSLPPSLSGRSTTHEKWVPGGLDGPSTTHEKWVPGGLDGGPSKPSSRYVSHSSASSSANETVVVRPRVGSIADYDPVNDNYGSLTQGYQPSSTTTQCLAWEETVPISPPPPPPASTVAPLSPARSTGSVPSTSDLASSELEEAECSASRFNVKHSTSADDEGFDEQDSHVCIDDEVVNITDGTTKPDIVQHQVIVENDEEKKTTIVSDSAHVDNQGRKNADKRNQLRDEPTNDEEEQGTSLKGAVFVAVYDYDIADDDEVSFIEGDRVISATLIDDGWMIGTVSRTGKRGMVPTNYFKEMK